jgi:hypothetical protein
MLAKLSGAMGVAVAVALIAVALWGWADARQLAQRTEEPLLTLWAVRSASVAAFAAAQMLGLTFLVGVFYDRDQVGEMMRLAAGLVCTAALVGAITLGVLSR